MLMKSGFPPICIKKEERIKLLDQYQVTEEIINYAKDNGIYTFNISIINKILKGLKLNNYYKFASIFLCKINGKHVPNAIGSEDIKK